LPPVSNGQKIISEIIKQSNMDYSYNIT